MFSTIKMEEYMESELSGNFRVKLVTKNIVHGSPGTQFMHMRVKASDLKNLLLTLIHKKVSDIFCDSSDIA